MKPSIRDIGTYSINEASHYLHLAPSTLRAWSLGQNARPGKRFQPVFKIADREDRLLSFNNMVEAHILSAIRKVHSIPLPKIRQALKYMEKVLGTQRPLLEKKFQTNGLDLFVEHSGSLLNVTRDGQTELKAVIERYLERIERDPKGMPIKLYPFSRSEPSTNVRQIVIDPSVAFGRPILVGTGIPTANIFERFQAGESIVDLSKDFAVESAMVEEAIRCEQVPTSAA